MNFVSLMLKKADGPSPFENPFELDQWRKKYAQNPKIRSMLDEKFAADKPELLAKLRQPVGTTPETYVGAFDPRTRINSPPAPAPTQAPPPVPTRTAAPQAPAQNQLVLPAPAQNQLAVVPPAQSQLAVAPQPRAVAPQPRAVAPQPRAVGPTPKPNRLGGFGKGVAGLGLGYGANLLADKYLPATGGTLNTIGRGAINFAGGAAGGYLQGKGGWMNPSRLLSAAKGGLISGGITTGLDRLNAPAADAPTPDNSDPSGPLPIPVIPPEEEKKKVPFDPGVRGPRKFENTPAPGPQALPDLSTIPKFSEPQAGPNLPTWNPIEGGTPQPAAPAPQPAPAAPTALPYPGTPTEQTPIDWAKYHGKGPRNAYNPKSTVDVEMLKQMQQAQQEGRSIRQVADDPRYTSQGHAARSRANKKAASYPGM